MKKEYKRNLIFLGAPGAGKGTIAGAVKDKAKLVHISTGDIFRSEIKNETELGKQVKDYIDSGRLVPDELVADMIKGRLAQSDCDNGFILDGFPRTLVQGELLDNALESIGRSLCGVFFFQADDELLIQRLTARLTCRDCGVNFNKQFKLPKVEGICDECGGELYQRKDDSLETAQERLKIFHSETAPLIDFYKQKGLLHEVDATQELEIKVEILTTLTGVH